MSRIDKARQAFLKKNINEIKNTHTSHAIRSSIKHGEAHIKGFNLPEVILGGQDGLVNVLGITLGMGAATASNHLVIVAGLAATFAESISMAAVAYTSKLAEADYYQSEYERERWEIEHIPQGEKEEVKEIYRQYGFTGKTLDEIVEKITSKKDLWLKSMMEQELKLEPVERKQAFSVGVIVGVSAIIGSLIPLIPYLVLPVKESTMVSVGVSAVTLFAVGFYKAKKTLGRHFIKEGLELMFIGMLSAFVGYLVGSLLHV